MRKGKYSHYTDNPLRKECLNYSFVGNLAEDKEGNIWICTEGGGLNFMDRKTRTFKYFTAGHRNSVLQNNLKCIAYDGGTVCISARIMEGLPATI